jgi:hypothetical protein
MAWKCRLVDPEKLREEKKNLQPGDMYYVPAIVDDEDLAGFYRKNILSPEYMRDWFGKRPPIIIILPTGTPWLIDSRFSGGSEDKARKPNGWVITGTEPNLTATPSINHLGANGYHGWLKNGELSDDLEGRKYDER